MTGLPFPSVRGTARPPEGMAGMPDQLGRVARDLRVSVTDRCNLRCRYCMPAEGLPWLAKPEMLSDDELVRVIGVFVGLGITQVRLTGGEPLLRRSLVDVVRRSRGSPPVSLIWVIPSPTKTPITRTSSSSLSISGLASHGSPSAGMQ